MQTVHPPGDRVNAHAILEARGYRVRNSRADCPQCSGHSRLTVAIRGELYYCHRCQRGGNVRALARQQGLHVPPPRIRKADKPEAAFRAWLSATMDEMSRLECRLYRRKVWAEAALSFFPDFEPAWEALACWYHSEHRFQTFWQSASDRAGRYWMYRTWKKYAS